MREPQKNILHWHKYQCISKWFFFLSLIKFLLECSRLGKPFFFCSLEPHISFKKIFYLFFFSSLSLFLVSILYTPVSVQIFVLPAHTKNYTKKLFEIENLKTEVRKRWFNYTNHRECFWSRFSFRCRIMFRFTSWFFFL